MHEYLAEYGNSLTYKNCVYCLCRKSTICIRCNYCYSCHFIIERFESSSKQIPIRAGDAKSSKNEKKHRIGRFEANFIVYNIEK
jgi:hypothetical protein